MVILLLLPKKLEKRIVRRVTCRIEKENHPLIVMFRYNCAFNIVLVILET
jgi:hypothetical protein